MNNEKVFENKFNLKPNDIALLDKKIEVKIISLEFDNSIAIVEDIKTGSQIPVVINHLKPKT